MFVGGGKGMKVMREILKTMEIHCSRYPAGSCSWRSVKWNLIVESMGEAILKALSRVDDRRFMTNRWRSALESDVEHRISEPGRM